MRKDISVSEQEWKEFQEFVKEYNAKKAKRKINKFLIIIKMIFHR